MRAMCVLGLLVGLSLPVVAGNGDTNLDGRVDLADASAALRYIAGLDQPSFGQRVAADVPTWRTTEGLGPVDGVVTVADVVQITRLAAGLDPVLPDHPLPTAISLNRQGDITQNVALDAGYQLSGLVLDSNDIAVDCDVAFERWTMASIGTPSYAFPADVTGPNGFSVRLQPGRYVPWILKRIVTSTPLGGVTRVGVPSASVWTNPPGFEAGGDTTALTLRYLGQDTPLRVAYVSSQPAPGVPYTPREVHLSVSTDNGTELYGAHRTVAPDSGAWMVYPSAYAVRLIGDLALSDGSTESWTTYIDGYTVPNTTPLAVVVGPFVEVTGKVTPPQGFTAQSVELLEIDTLAPNVTLANPFKVLTSVPVRPDGTYRIAGTRNTFALVFTTASPEFIAKITVQYRFGTDSSMYNLAIPDAFLARTVSGQVVGPNGHPVANAKVAISHPPYSGRTYSTFTTTDPQGFYSARIPNGSYALQVSFLNKRICNLTLPFTCR